jgi:hypothetical protein
VFFNLISGRLFYSKLNNIKLNNKYKISKFSYINIAKRLRAASDFIYFNIVKRLKATSDFIYFNIIKRLKIANNFIYFNIVKRLRAASDFIYFNIIKRLKALFLGFIYIILAILLLYKKRIKIIKIKS